MKLNNKTVKAFEKDQKAHGTETALYNVIWLIAVDILHGIGVKNIKTTSKSK
jgi:hypothetical protein